jgi:DoxX-like family
MTLNTGATATRQARLGEPAAGEGIGSMSERRAAMEQRKTLTRRDRIVYRTTTGIVSAVMVYSIINFTFIDRFPFPEGGFVHLGLPNYFRIELTVAKILGLLALLTPGVPSKVKEFAYFGFAITLLSASIAHFSAGDWRISPLFILDPLIFLGLLSVSYYYFNKTAREQRHEPRPTVAA